ncbi:fatty acid desaturase [Reichenbachiella sp. MALMAid0571]|uniref:fatty acid desaturase family protein n=1 Tax=Reichenbachiella sp. MALMAid0571 TaxID=3143939 RepID=UPI0032DEF5DF
MLRKKADLKTLLWMIASTALFFFLWNSNEFIWWLYIPYLYFAVCFSVFAHNHNHLSLWKNKYLNQFHSCWITVFYGFPTFAWIPTHNTNHHRHNNKEPDYTKTYMVSEKNNLWTLLIYPTLSGMAQQKAVFNYYKEQYGKNWEKFTFYTLQIVCLVSWIAVAFIIDWQKALIYVFIPQQVSLNVVLVFNYIQHVHADEESKYNHSRNIVGWPLNFFLFNNGYHTIHHMQSGLHWSETPAAHKKIEHLIDDNLKEKYMFWYLFRVYILGLFIPSLRTDSMRLARQEREFESSEVVATNVSAVAV